MTADTWHAPDDLLVRFAADARDLDEITASSIEQHLIGCAACRHTISAATDAETVEGLWAEIADRVDRTPTDRRGRMRTAWHLDRPAVRLIAATGQLQTAAVAAVLAITAGSALVAGADSETSLPFLALAPLVVLATIALAFAPAAEPAGELTAATPLYGFGLFVRRASAVLVATLAPLLLTSMLLPDSRLTAYAWVLPSLAMALGALALARRYGAPTAATAIGFSWLAALTILFYIQHGHVSPTTLVATVDLQIPALLAVGLSLFSLVHQRDSLDRAFATNGSLLP